MWLRDEGNRGGPAPARAAPGRPAGRDGQRRTADRRPRRLPAGDDGQPRRPPPQAEAAEGAAVGQAALHGPGPGLPDPPPQRRRDPRRHRPAPLGGQRRQGELRWHRQPLRQSDPEARRRRAGTAARPRPRPQRAAGRGDDPHAHRPHLGDLRVPQLGLHRQRDRVEGGGGRPETAPQRLPAPALRLRLRLPHRRLRPRRDRLLRDLRAHLRPLRRWLDPPRLHARP